MRYLFSTRTRAASRQTRVARARHLSLERLEDRQLLTAVAPPSGLISWWTADNTAADLMTLNNASMFNGANFAAGIVGQAFNFDGVNDRAQVADADSLKFTASMAIEGWLRVDSYSTSSGEILFRGDDRGGLDPYQLSVRPNGKLVFTVSSLTGGVAVETPVPLGQFIHVAATLEDATGSMRLYVDGALAAQTVTTFRPFRDLDPASNPSIGIGSHGGYPTTPHSFLFDGLIDELSVYDRALTPGEIQGIYSAGGSGKIRNANYFATDYPTVTEGAAATTTTATFAVNRVGSLAGQAIVNWTTADATATAGADYVAASGQLVFLDGESQRTVQVTVNGDSTPETNETFWLALSTTTPGYTAGGGLATIADDDAAISVDDVQVTEGDLRLGAVGALVNLAGNGGLNRSTGMTYGPDGRLYVGSLNSNEVLRYDAITGASMGAFVAAGSGGLDGPAVDGLVFRPDGRLYVASRNSSSVLRYDASTGAYLDTIIPTGSGGLLQPKGMVFAPDGSVLISSGTNEVLRYSGATGAFLGAFVTAGSGGLSNPRSLTFGPDGNLYVSSSGSHAVLKYNGTTGAFLSTFVVASSGGLNGPGGLLFFNGRLYVASQNTNQVLRYDAVTGAFIDDAVPANSDGLDRPIGLMFDADQNLLVGGFAELMRYATPYTASFTIRLNHAVATPITVDYATTSGTAQAISDFTAVAGTVTFAPGEAVKTVRVRITDDAVGEPTETFTVNLSSPVGGSIADGVGVGTIIDNDPGPTKFYVVNEATADRTYEYTATGTSVENYAINAGNTAPRGAASTAAGDKVWVVDANKKVYVYNVAGGLLGSWTAGSMNNSAQVEGIATDGTDIWLVDNKTDKVFRYTNAAGRLSGTQNAASSFSLYMKGNSSIAPDYNNSNAKDIVTDGTSLWVINDGASEDKVFKYSLGGVMAWNNGWTIDPANSKPTGFTLDPGNPDHLWIVDAGTKRVYQYNGGVARVGGGLAWSASSSFALAAGNTNPQGIADPPPGGLLSAVDPTGGTPTASSRPATASVRATRWVSLFVLPPGGDLVPFASGPATAGPLALRSRFMTARRRL